MPRCDLRWVGRIQLLAAVLFLGLTGCQLTIGISTPWGNLGPGCANNGGGAGGPPMPGRPNWQNMSSFGQQWEQMPGGGGPGPGMFGQAPGGQQMPMAGQGPMQGPIQGAMPGPTQGAPSGMMMQQGATRQLPQQLPTNLQGMSGMPRAWRQPEGSGSEANTGRVFPTSAEGPYMPQQ